MFYKNSFSLCSQSQLSYYYSTLVPFADLMSKGLVARCKFCFLMLTTKQNSWMSFSPAKSLERPGRIIVMQCTHLQYKVIIWIDFLVLKVKIHMTKRKSQIFVKMWVFLGQEMLLYKTQLISPKSNPDFQNLLINGLQTKKWKISHMDQWWQPWN